MIVPIRFVYKHLVCEFDHWDICITGLIFKDGKYWFCKLLGDESQDNPEYLLTRCLWTEECEEYLDDYRVAYKHWVYKNGKRLESYGGQDLSWFSEKWNGRNPIEDSLSTSE